MTPAQHDQHVERIALTLVGLSRDRQAELLVEAFCQAFAGRPDIPADQARPWIMGVTAQVMQRISQMEKERGWLC